MPTRNSRVSALDDIGDPDAPAGSRPWARWMLLQGKSLRRDLNNDVRRLQKLIEKLEKYDAWKPLGFVSFNLLCHYELDLSDEEIDLIRKATPGRALGEVLNLGQHGGDRKSEEAKNQGTGSTLKCRGGTAEYRTLRMKRDRPDLAARVESGELSLPEAEREQGIDPRGRRLWMPVDAAEAASTIRERFGNEFARELGRRLRGSG
jgi:hypothetical protein